MHEEPYRSNLSEERQRELLAWHELDYRYVQSRVGEREVYLGRPFDVFPNVYAPHPIGELLGEMLLREVRSTDRVLDMGTGTGVNAVLAASCGAEVVAVDVNPHAVSCAIHNAELNGVSSRVRVLESDVFDHVEGRFDLIVFDPPFRWARPRDLLERSLTDERYESLRKFISQLRDRLNRGGRALMLFGTSGDIDYLHRLVDQHALQREVVRKLSTRLLGADIDYEVLRLTG